MPGTELSVRELDAAVAEVNRIWLAKGLEAAKAVGVYLLRVFYDGNLSARRGGGGAPGVPALAGAPQLGVGRNPVGNMPRPVVPLEGVGA